MLLSHIQNVICGVLCSYKFSVLRLSTYMQCIHSGLVPFLLNMFFLLPLPFVDGWHTRQIPNYPTRKSPEMTDPLMKLVIPHS